MAALFTKSNTEASRCTDRTFRAAQYNILASYLGSNTEPWFLYGGLTGTNEEMQKKAEAVGLKHCEKGADGKYINVGWPNYVTGILTPEEIAAVEETHARHFDWEKRAPKIVDTIRDLDTDVLSLVELDKYQDFFQPRLEQMGLDSVWTKRPRLSSHDGCAICWKRSKFELVAHESLTYKDDTTGQRKDRVALIVLLRFREASPQNQSTYLIFASTHLARNPESMKQNVIRLRQTAQLMLALKDFAKRHECESDVPAIIAGDMNAACLESMRAMAVAYFSLRVVEHAEPPPPLWIMKDVPTPSTSFTFLRRIRIDYLLHSEMFLAAEHVRSPKSDLALLGDEQDSQHAVIPDDIHPSDHLPVAVDFRYKTQEEVAQDCAHQFVVFLLTGDIPRPLFPHEIDAAFSYFSKDGSDMVSAEQLVEGTKRLGISDLTTEARIQLRDLLCTASPGLDASCTLATFYEALQSQLAHWPNENNDKPFILKAFDQMDSNGLRPASVQWVE